MWFTYFRSKAIFHQISNNIKMRHLSNVLNSVKSIGKSALAIARKPITYLSLIAALSMPVSAQTDPDDYPPEINIGDFLNPYKQPNDRSLDWYGSGDVDGDGMITYWGDFTAMVAGAQNDRADVDGDGIPSTTEDIAHFQDYWDGNIDYLQGWWNRLQTREERESWLVKMLEIDQTDTLEWINGSVEDRFVSGNFSDQLEMNFYGFNKQNEDDNDIPSKYDTTNVGRFNIPLYRVSVDHLGSDWGHGMNAILLGENPLNFYDWSFIEPQEDSINVTPPSWNMPYNSTYRIQGMWSFNFSDMAFPFNIVRFLINEVGEDSLYMDPADSLVTERPNWISDFPEGIPPVGIDEDRYTTPSDFELHQNYPNPFNPRTTIKYEVPLGGPVNIRVYNSKGELVRNLVEGDKNPGTYTVDFDGSDLPSGLYISRLQAGRHIDSEKMLLVK